jgi:AraC-like DNA-binding protein
MDKVYKYEELDVVFPFRVKYAHMKPFYDMGRKYHWHNYLEISYVKEGKGRYHIEDRYYDLIKGDIIVINNIEAHYMEVLPPDDMIQPVLMIDPDILYSGVTDSYEYDYLAPFFNRSESFNNRIDGKDVIGRQIFGLLEEITSEYSSGQRGHELMIKTKLLNVMTLLFRHFTSDMDITDETKERSKRLSRISASLSYINKNSSSSLTLEKLAELSFMTPSYFSSYFHATTGQTPFGYVSHVRISNAIRLLRTSETSIADIAETVGFNNLSHFNRVFLKLTGKRPRELR